MLLSTSGPILCAWKWPRTDIALGLLGPACLLTLTLRLLCYRHLLHANSEESLVVLATAWSTHVPLPAWGAVFCFSLLRDIRQLPSASSSRRLHVRTRLIGTSGSALALLVLLLGGLLGGTTALLTEDSLTWEPTAGPPADAVIMLYDSKYPRILYGIAAFPMTLAAKLRGRPAIVAPLDAQTLLAARDQKGAIVFVASEGANGALYSQDTHVDPRREGSHRGHGGPALVYLSGCHCGTKGRLWEDFWGSDALIAYNRVTVWEEHVLWLWTRCPQLILEGL